MLGTLQFDRARFNMVEQQVRPWEVLDPRVLEALSEIKREDFVPPRYRKLAFADLALPLEHGEQMMKPVVEGRMLQALELGPDDEVLEIGTGSGFLSACLARLARQVSSIELHADLADRARSRLQAAGLRNVTVQQQDVYADYRPATGFDAIAVTGAVASVPEAWRGWLNPGGRLFVVRGHAPVMEAVVIARRGELFEERSLFETELTYLRGGEAAAQFEF